MSPATVPAAPMSATSTAQMSAPATVTEMRPTRSTSRPDGRPVTMPATPKPASTAPRALEPRPKLSLQRSATRKPRLVTPA